LISLEKYSARPSLLGNISIGYEKQKPTFGLLLARPLTYPAMVPKNSSLLTCAVIPGMGKTWKSKISGVPIWRNVTVAMRKFVPPASITITGLSRGSSRPVPM